MRVVSIMVVLPAVYGWRHAYTVEIEKRMAENYIYNVKTSCSGTLPYAKTKKRLTHDKVIPYHLFTGQNTRELTGIDCPLLLLQSCNQSHASIVRNFIVSIDENGANPFGYDSCDIPFPFKLLQP
jgi:hypothetical protein